MKKFTAVLLVVFMSAMFISYDFSDAAGSFTIRNGTLVEYSGNDEEVVIPNGVVSIGSAAFSGCTAKKIIIPDTVTEIQNGAFFQCTNLKEITIPSRVTSIGHSAFEGCTSLERVNINSSVLKNIDDEAFMNCKSLKSIEIPYGITSINERTFAGCNSLKTISLPDSVTVIKKYAFSECYDLDITLPDSVTTIEDFAFYCLRAREVTLPAGLVSISPYAFKYCTDMERINVPESNPNFTSIDGVLFSKDKKVLVQYPRGNFQKSYTVPDGVTMIGDYAFYDCFVENVRLPDSVTVIGSEAFAECTLLKRINIPKRLKTIGEKAFYQCFNLSGRIDLPNTVTSIGQYAFYLCYNITGATLPNRLTVIEDGLFSGCAKLTEVNIPDRVKSIGKLAFNDCYVLTSLRLPDSVTSIGEMAFYNSHGLESIEIPKSVTSIGEKAFSDCINLTIYTPKGSYAQSYAQKNGIRYSSGAFKAPDTVSKILIDEFSLMLHVGETANLNATVVPATARDKSIKWSSANTKVVKVDKTGKLTAVGEGRTVVEAISTSNPKIRQACRIYVLPSHESVDTMPKLTNNIKNGVRFTDLKKELRDFWNHLEKLYQPDMNVTQYRVTIWMPGYSAEISVLLDSVIINVSKEWNTLDKLIMKKVLEATVQNPQEVYDVYDKYFSGDKWRDNWDRVFYVGNVKCYLTQGFVCKRTYPGEK